LIKHYVRFYKQYYDHPELMKGHFLLKKKYEDVIHAQKVEFEKTLFIQNGEVGCEYDWEQGIKNKKKLVNILSSELSPSKLSEQMKDLWK